MFSKIGSALQAAADVVAPPCARVDDLRYHWSQVVDACQKSQGPSPFIDNAIVGDPGISVSPNTPISTAQPDYVNTSIQNSSEVKASETSAIGATEKTNGLMQQTSIYGCVIRASMVPAVEETHVPRHLGHMLRILVGEDRGGWGSLSPCLEFLVTERVLLSLASFAWCDRPLGIRQHAYIFLSSVLNHLHHSHLHHARIHKPLQSMVRASSEMTASPYEAQEMDYLTALCEKIRQDHSLVLLYIQPTVMESPPCHYTPDEGFTTGSSGSAVAVSSSPSVPLQQSPSHSSQSNSEPSNCPTPRQDLSNSSQSKQSDDQSQVHADNLVEKQSCESASSSITEDKFQHRRTSSSHSISSTHSSDSSTRCSSVSSTPLSLVSGSSAWTLTRGSRHTGLQSSFPLVAALLNLCHSADSSINAAAHECLLLLCAVREPVCGKTVARHTLYPHYVASRVAESIAAAPSDIDPVLVEDLTLPKEGAKTYSDRATAAASGPEISSSDSEDNDSTATDEAEEDFQGRRELLKMLHWLAYCDKVVCASDSILSTSLCHCLREIVLDGEVRPLMTSTSPEVVSYSLALLSRLLTSLTAHSLVMSIVKWLCSGSSAPSCDEASGYEEGVLPLLLELCRDSEHQVQALRLFQTAVESSCGGGAALLTSSWLEQRRYFDSSAAEVQQDCWSDEEDERARQRQAQDALSPGSQPISRTFAPNNINRIVKQFLSLVPEDLQSSGSDDFDSYKSDAIRQCRDMARSSSLHQWGREATAHPLDIHSQGDTSSLCSRESPPEDDRTLGCSLGPFLDMLLDLLEKLPQQEYDVNLQVTCVISSLALLPLPHLHEFLLNPSLPVAAGARTPYTVLRSVMTGLADHVLAAPDYRQHLKLARHQLLGAINTWEIERDDEDRKFEALIVIEEFCKELASIAHAKYTVEVEG